MDETREVLADCNENIPFDELGYEWKAQYEQATSSYQMYCRDGWCGPIQAVQTINRLIRENTELNRKLDQIISG